MKTSIKQARFPTAAGSDAFFLLANSLRISYKEEKAPLFHHIMLKRAIPFLLWGCCSLATAQPEVSVQLASTRTEYRTHDETAKPGFALKLELSPAPGISLVETEKLKPELTITDALGKKYKAASARIYASNDGSGKSYAEFTTTQRPSGAKIKIEGTLNLTVARDKKLHAPFSFELLGEERSVQVGDITFHLTPHADNAQKGNRDGERLHRAQVALRYPASVTIMQISRHWVVDDEEHDLHTSLFIQELDYKTTLSENKEEQTTNLVLVDALPCPTLQISTCTEKKDISLPLHFDVTLSEAVEISLPEEETTEKKPES